MRVACTGFTVLFLSSCLGGTMGIDLDVAGVESAADDGGDAGEGDGGGSSQPTTLVTDSPFPADLGFSSPTASGQRVDGLTAAEQAQLESQDRRLQAGESSPKPKQR